MNPAQALQRPHYIVHPQLAKPLAIAGAIAIVAGIVASVAIAIFALAVAPIAIPFTAALAVGGTACLLIGVKSFFLHNKIDQMKAEVDQLIKNDKVDEAKEKIGTLPIEMQKPALKHLVAQLLKGVPDQKDLEKAHQIMQLPGFSEIDREIAVEKWIDQLPLQQAEHKYQIKQMVNYLLNNQERRVCRSLDHLVRSALKQGDCELAWFYASTEPSRQQVINACFNKGQIKVLEWIEMSRNHPAGMGCDLRCRLAQHYLDKNWPLAASRIMEKYRNGNVLSPEILYDTRLYRSLQLTFLRLSFSMVADPFFAKGYLEAAIDDQFNLKKDSFCAKIYNDPQHPYHALCQEGKFGEALDLLHQEWKASKYKY